MSVYHHEGLSADRLLNLLHRNQKLVRLDVKEKDELPTVCRAIKEGCCKGLERLGLLEDYSEFTQERLSLLVGVFQVDGALAALRTLEIHYYIGQPVGIQLMTILGSGAAPSIRLSISRRMGLMRATGVSW
jgi:hypothetical protein